MIFCFICNYRYINEKVGGKEGQKRREVLKQCAHLLELPWDKVKALVKDLSFHKRFPLCRKCTQCISQVMPSYYEIDRLEEQVSKLQEALMKKLKQLEEAASIVNQTVKRFRHLAKKSDAVRRNEIKAYLEKPKKYNKKKCKNADEIGDEVLEQTLRDLVIKSDPKNNKEEYYKQGEVSWETKRLVEGYPAQFAIPESESSTGMQVVVVKEEPVEIQDVPDDVEDHLYHFKEEMTVDPPTPLASNENDDTEQGYDVNAGSDNIENDQEEDDVPEWEPENEYEMEDDDDHDDDDDLDEEDDSIGWFSGVKTDPQEPQTESISNRIKTEPQQDIKSENSKTKFGFQQTKVRPVKPLRKWPRTKQTEDTSESIREGLRRRVTKTTTVKKDSDSESDWDLDSAEDESASSDGSVWSGDEMGKERAELQEQQRKAREEKQAATQERYDHLIGLAETTHDGKSIFHDIQIIDKGDAAFECGQCGKLITSNHPSYGAQLADRYIRQHIIEKHTQGYLCRLCPEEKEKRLQSMRAVLKHNKTHKQEIVPCTICQKPYKSRSSKSFKYHLWTHKSQQEKDDEVAAGIEAPKYPTVKIKHKNYQCAQCGRKFEGPKALKLHENTHMDKAEREKLKIPCHICGKMYFKHSIESHHRYVHQKELQQTYTCEICGPDRKFMLKSQLRSHIRSIHNKEKRFSCDLCDHKCFALTSLKQHMNAVHFHIKPFKCDFCSQSFAAIHNVRRHMRTVHADNKVREPKKRSRSTAKRKRKSRDQDSDSDTSNSENEVSTSPTPTTSNAPLTNTGYNHQQLPMPMGIGFSMPIIPGSGNSYNWNPQDYSNAHFEHRQ